MNLDTDLSKQLEEQGIELFDLPMECKAICVKIGSIKGIKVDSSKCSNQREFNELIRKCLCEFEQDLLISISEIFQGV